MVTTAIKIAAAGVLVFWIAEALAFFVHLVRAGVFRAIREDRADRSIGLTVS